MWISKVSDVIGSSPVSFEGVTADAPTNSLVIQASREGFGTLSDVIAQLDIQFHRHRGSPGEQINAPEQRIQPPQRRQRAGRSPPGHPPERARKRV